MVDRMLITRTMRRTGPNRTVVVVKSLRQLDRVIALPAGVE